MSDYHANSLSDALRRVAGGPFLAAATDRVAKNAVAIAAQLQHAVLADVPEFSKSRNPDLLPELAHHGREHIDEIVRLLRGGGLGRFDFVHEHARRRAEQRFPLEATLHAYRSGHKVLSRWLRESALTAASPAEDAQRAIAAIADFAMEYTDAISTTFAGTYSSHSLMLADVAGDQRSQLLQILLDGYDEADVRAARILRDAGFLDERQSFCVALARSVDPIEMLNASRARRLADSIEHIVAEMGVRRLIDVHTNKVTMVFAAVRRDSGSLGSRQTCRKTQGECNDQTPKADASCCVRARGWIPRDRGVRGKAAPDPPLPLRFGPFRSFRSSRGSHTVQPDGLHFHRSSGHPTRSLGVHAAGYLPLLACRGSEYLYHHVSLSVALLGAGRRHRRFAPTAPHRAKIALTLRQGRRRISTPPGSSRRAFASSRAGDGGGNGGATAVGTTKTFPSTAAGDGSSSASNRGTTITATTPAP